MDKKRFEERLLQLRGDRSRNSVAKEIPLNPQTLERYEKGERLPDVEIISQIANYYNVSVDWLLGIDKNQVSERELLAEISSYLGLTEKAVKKIREMTDHKSKHSLVSSLFCMGSFCEMVSGIESLKCKSEYMRYNCLDFLENGTPLEVTADDLDVIRYTVHKILEYILDFYDFRCDKDYNAIKDKMTEQLDDDFMNPKK